MVVLGGWGLSYERGTPVNDEDEGQVWGQREERIQATRSLHRQLATTRSPTAKAGGHAALPAQEAPARGLQDSVRKTQDLVRKTQDSGNLVNKTQGGYHRVASLFTCLVSPPETCAATGAYAPEAMYEQALITDY